MVYRLVQRACLTLVLTLLIPAPSQAREVVGDFITPTGSTTVSVVDGDGLRIGNLRVRLWGIDAPELKQICHYNDEKYSCGEDARFLLGALIMGGDLRCQVKDIDRYNRTVAQCTAGGQDVAAELVRQGYALDWKSYSKGFYKEQEAEAREQKRGLWSGEFTEPWEWRKTKRKK